MAWTARNKKKPLDQAEHSIGCWNQPIVRSANSI